jgi:hypothetical protein
MIDVFEGDCTPRTRAISNWLRFLFIALSAQLDVTKSWQEAENLTPERKIQLEKG